jgi:hypothetical protein
MNLINSLLQIDFDLYIFKLLEIIFIKIDLLYQVLRFTRFLNYLHFLYYIFNKFNFYYTVFVKLVFTQSIIANSFETHF